MTFFFGQLFSKTHMEQAISDNLLQLLCTSGEKAPASIFWRERLKLNGFVLEVFVSPFLSGFNQISPSSSYRIRTIAGEWLFASSAQENDMTFLLEKVLANLNDLTTTANMDIVVMILQKHLRGESLGYNAKILEHCNLLNIRALRYEDMSQIDPTWLCG
jgi:hypothetical protein